MPRRHVLIAAIALAACVEDPVSPAKSGLDEPATESMKPQLHLAATVAGSWITRRPMLTARDHLAVGVVANASGQSVLYALGGKDDTSRPLARVEAYNAASNAWTVKASLPSARYLANGTGTIAGKLYVSGGVLASGAATRSLLAYNPATNTWAARARMPVASAQGVTAVINGKLYVLIGSCTGCSEGTRVRRLYRYDPITNNWTRRADAPSAHVLGAAGVIAGKLYVAGGQDAQGRVTAALHVYNPATNTWAARARMPTARQEAAAGVIGGKLYLAGGRDVVGELSVVEAYNPSTNTWTTSTPMPTARAGLAAGVGKDATGRPKLFALGGFSGGAGVLSTNEAFGTATPSPDFSLSCDPATPTIPQTSAGTITCTATSRNGFTGSVSIAAGSAPAGVSLAPFAGSVTVPANGSAHVAVSVDIAGSVALGHYSFGIVGTSGTLSRTFTGQLTVSANTARVHVVYLVPSDKTSRADYVRATDRAVRHLQIWYRNTLGTGETFTISNPAVSVYHTAHSSEWYNTNNPAQGATTFWFNVLADGFALTGGGFNQPNDVWVYYIDADPAPGQAVGGAAGVALLPANDLRGLVGQLADPVCRWVGGLGHELGHALGLPHPAECDPVQTPDCPIYALMFFGYTTYPSASLTASDRQMLAASAFFSPVAVTGTMFDCSSLAPTTLLVSRHASSVLATRSATPACGYGLLRNRLALAATAPRN